MPRTIAGSTITDITVATAGANQQTTAQTGDYEEKVVVEATPAGTLTTPGLCELQVIHDTGTSDWRTIDQFETRLDTTPVRFSFDATGYEAYRLQCGSNVGASVTWTFRRHSTTGL